MSITIRVDREVYDRLKEDAEPFVDTPNSVLRRLLGMPLVKEPLSELEDSGGNGSAPSRSTTAGDRPARKGRRRVPATGKGSRAASDSILPEHAYELPILRALVEAGGSAQPRTVLGRVGEMLEKQLTPVDREKLRSGGVRWESRVQFVRLHLLEQGLMDRSAPRGTWAISDDGRALVAASQE